MGHNMEFTDLPISKTVYENYVEDKLETDVTIPDYYPSVLKVLRCEANAIVTHYVVENERILFDGVCKWTLLYCSSDDDKVHCYETTSNFTETFNIKSEISKPQIKFKTKTTNVICKLHNSQRASLRASFCIAVKVQTIQSVEAICKIDEENVQVLCSKKRVCPRVLTGEKEFAVSCEVSVDESIGVTEILKSDASANIRDTKVIQDKVIIKGECDTKILYLSESGEMSVLTGTMPFSQIIEVPDIAENATCVVYPCVTDIQTAMSETEERAITLDMTVQCRAAGYLEAEVSVISDAYSTTHEIECSTQKIALDKPMKPERYDRKVSLVMDLPFDIQKIQDVSAMADIQKISAGENVICIDGNIVLKTYVLTGDEIKSVERSFPFNVTADMRDTCDHLRCEADVRVNGVSFKMDSSDKISIDTDLVFDVALFAEEHLSVLTDLKVAEEKTEKRVPLVMYYGHKGEKLWDIAKKYGASVSEIKYRNQLLEDFLLDDKMILVKM